MARTRGEERVVEGGGLSRLAASPRLMGMMEKRARTLLREQGGPGIVDLREVAAAAVQHIGRAIALGEVESVMVERLVARLRVSAASAA